MGRRKIEIKQIKDDRNRSVTFLKRKGGLFKKAHELSVLCNVEVAVIIFGSNKKLHEYASHNIQDMITKYSYHAGPTEHRGPSDYNGGIAGGDDDDGSDPGTPSNSDGQEPHMLSQQFQGPPFAHIRQHTPSASPPIQNGAFMPHPGHPAHRGHTPQPPHMGSRPSSRNDMRRMGQPVGSSGPAPPAANGFAYMPQPAIYNPNGQNQPNMPPNMAQGMQQPGPQYPYPPPQAHAHQMQSFMEDQRRSSLPPNFPPQQQGPPRIQRHSISPPQPAPSQLPPQHMHHMSPPPPHHHPMQSPPLPQHQQQQQQMHYQQQQQHEQQQHQLQQQQQQQQQQEQKQQRQEQQHPPQVQVQEPLAPPPDVKQEPNTSMRKPPLLDTAFIKRLPQRKGGSIFTPIDENRSILAQHLSAFHPASDPPKSEADNRSSKVTSSPPQLQRLNTHFNNNNDNNRHDSVTSIPESTTFTVPSRTSSMMTSAGSRPRLKVQIPEGASETGGSAAAETSSPRNPSTDTMSQHSRGPGIVLPPPSPSASAILSAGASGPVNPFARPIPQQHQSMHIDTPVSALPSRVMNDNFLPSPSSFFPDWNHSNTLPSPLNFATPLVANGPSFLREDTTPHKRKSPDADHGNEPKRIKVDS